MYILYFIYDSLFVLYWFSNLHYQEKPIVYEPKTYMHEKIFIDKNGANKCAYKALSVARCYWTTQNK